MVTTCVLLQPKQKEMATFKWEMVQKAMTTLNVSEEEAKGIWSLIAAIYHLGYAGVRKGRVIIYCIV